MFELSNGKRFERLKVVLDDEVVGLITKTSKGKYTYKSLVTLTGANFRYLVTLTDGSSHEDIVKFLNRFVVTEKRVDRSNIIPPWVSSIEDELFVTQGNFTNTSRVEFAYE